MADVEANGMIELWQSVQWRAPLWLALATVPLLFMVWRMRRRARVLRYADASLLPWAARAPQAAGSRLRGLAHAVAWGLLALAAAGPRTPVALEDGRPTERHRVTVIAIVDVSASMRAADIAPDRLTRARLELHDWLAQLDGERVGLVIYAGAAGVVLPPTDDLSLVRRALDQIDPAWLDAEGTDLGSALSLAHAQLAAAPGRAKAALVISDAEAGSVDAPAERAFATFAASRWPVFVLGVGSTAGATIPLAEGGIAMRDGVAVRSRMDLAPYKRLAEITGGEATDARDGESDWARLHQQGLARLPGDPLAAGQMTAWNDYFAWFLAPGLALLMVTLLPRRVVAAAVFGVLLASLASEPVQADESAAWQAWRAGDFAVALREYAAVGGYAGEMGAGAAAWRLADFAAAAGHFSAALLLAPTVQQRADALYNLGNAHYGRGAYGIAVEAYEAVLQMRPGDVHAGKNLAWARQRLSRQMRRPPTPSDLRGRRGMLAEGRIPLDSEARDPRDPPASPAPGVQIERRPGQRGDASEPPTSASAARVNVNPALVDSGLRKLDRLDDQPTTVLRNLLKQDARGDAAARDPW